MADAYDQRPGGSLKLKGSGADGGIVKKKKKSKSKSKTGDSERERDRERQRVKDLLYEEARAVRSESPGSGGDAGASSSRKTEAERRFEEVQKRRLAERVAKMATKTHKDRVSEFNSKLESLSEHHDIPKVGPG